jgi:arsenite methyltransferase
MLMKARFNASKRKVSNASFIKSRITSIDLPDQSADVVISNCVINLVPDEEKQLVFTEMHRILKPGGRVAVSDILTKKPLPEDMKQNVALYVGCIAGASSSVEYKKWLKQAGFEDVAIVDAGSDLNVYTSGDSNTGCCSGVAMEKPVSCCGGQEVKDGGVAEDMKRDLSNLDLNEWAGMCLQLGWKRPRSNVIQVHTRYLLSRGHDVVYNILFRSISSMNYIPSYKSLHTYRIPCGRLDSLSLMHTRLP